VNALYIGDAITAIEQLPQSRGLNNAGNVCRGCLNFVSYCTCAPVLGRIRIRHATVVRISRLNPPALFAEFGHPRGRARRKELRYRRPVLSYELSSEGVQWIRGHHYEGSHALNSLLAAYKLVASARAA